MLSVYKCMYQVHALQKMTHILGAGKNIYEINI